MQVAPLLLLATQAAAYTHAPNSLRSALARPAVSPLSPPLRPLRGEHALAVLPAPGRHNAVVASMAAAAPQPQSAGRVFLRAALACIATAFAFVLATARFAFAATKRAGASPISGDMLKYGFVGGCVALSYFFKKEETPIFRETVGAVDLDPETLKPIEAEAEKATPAAAMPPPEADEEAPPAPAIGDLDDSAIFGSLAARMQSLQEERDAAAAAPEEEDEWNTPPADSTDGWGEGSTAVLEPPKPGGEEDGPRGVFDGEPPLEFPPGYPVVDGEVVDNTPQPSASADQIAMLQRMMGNAE